MGITYWVSHNGHHIMGTEFSRNNCNFHLGLHCTSYLETTCMFKMLISKIVLHYTTYNTLLNSSRGVHCTIRVTFRGFLCFIPLGISKCFLTHVKDFCQIWLLKGKHPSFPPL
ncbi:hypothetical protein GDO81_021045 [Engystomops pustulosus]|uniref:Uncharacterized protein n=1 Tax=Engystomops pustulosus TaxID=76066 RepID=A0AAV6YVY2_ENGPU|nr:hypothetical protein GDO81_021045 [Engystomops pustulosus]